MRLCVAIYGIAVLHGIVFSRLHIVENQGGAFLMDLPLDMVSIGTHVVVVVMGVANA